MPKNKQVEMQMALLNSRVNRVVIDLGAIDHFGKPDDGFELTNKLSNKIVEMVNGTEARAMV